jgi:hypothetical protein
VVENAPTVLEMVAEQEKLASEEGSLTGRKKKPKEVRIRELQNDLEEPWCCLNGLAPIKSPATAILLTMLNTLLPGFGTLVSACIEKSSDPAMDETAKVKPQEDEEAFDDEEDDETIKRKEEE